VPNKYSTQAIKGAQAAEQLYNEEKYIYKKKENDV